MPRCRKQIRLLIRARIAEAALQSLLKVDARPPASRGNATSTSACWRRAWLALGDGENARAAMAGDVRAGLRPITCPAGGRVHSACKTFRCAADGYIQATLSRQPSLPAYRYRRTCTTGSGARLSQAGQGPGFFTHRDHHAWWLLQQEMRSAGSVAAQTRAWRQWRRDNCRPPRRPSIPPARCSGWTTMNCPRLRFCCHLSGRLAAAGAAVRDGLIAALLAGAGIRTGQPAILRHGRRCTCPEYTKPHWRTGPTF